MRLSLDSVGRECARLYPQDYRQGAALVLEQGRELASAYAEGFPCLPAAVRRDHIDRYHVNVLVDNGGTVVIGGVTATYGAFGEEAGGLRPLGFLALYDLVFIALAWGTSEHLLGD